MASSTLASVKRAMGRIAPLHLAGAWDNVGLLVESPVVNPLARRILLTIDLTPAVLEEALSSNSRPYSDQNPNHSPTSVIVAYHPTLFRPIKSLTLSNSPIQKTLLTCVASGISVYSPHTALDIVPGGVNDWLAEAVLDGRVNGDVEQIGELKDLNMGFKGEAGIKVGEGRMARFGTGLVLEDLVERVKQKLGLERVQLARSPTGPSHVKTVAVCAGSGGSIIGNVQADVYLTGEMSHHEVLAAVASNTHVILCGHTNTERPYLSSTLKKRLEDELKVDEPDTQYEVLVSKADAHPLEIV